MRTIAIILTYTMLLSMFTPAFSFEQTMVIDSTKYERYSRLNSLGLCFLTIGTGCSITTISLASIGRDKSENEGGLSGLGEAIACSIIFPTGASFLIAGTLLFVVSKVEMKKIQKLMLSSGINQIRLVYDF